MLRDLGLGHVNLGAVARASVTSGCLPSQAAPRITILSKLCVMSCLFQALQVNLPTIDPPFKLVTPNPLG
jgi:hypothetical protein